MLADVADALESGEPMERVAALERLYHVSYARRAPRVSGDAGRLRDAVLKAIPDLHGLFGDEAPGIESNAWVSLVRIGDRSDAVADALIEQIDLSVVDEESALIVHAAASYLEYFGRRDDVVTVLARAAATATNDVIRDAATLALGVHGSEGARVVLESDQSTAAARVALVALGKADFPTLEAAGRFRHSLYACGSCGRVWTDGPIWPDAAPASANVCAHCGAAGSGEPLWSAELDDRASGSRRSEFPADG